MTIDSPLTPHRDPEFQDSRLRRSLHRVRRNLVRSKSSDAANVADHRLRRDRPFNVDRDRLRGHEARIRADYSPHHWPSEDIRPLIYFGWNVFGRA